MKKRLRKKKHLGEFDKFGLIVSFDEPADKIEEIIDFVCDFADTHGLYAWGGGYGHISTQKVDGNYNIPQLTADIMMAIIYGEEEKPIFCIYSPQNLRVADELIAELESALNSTAYKTSIGSKQISLWHR